MKNKILLYFAPLFAISATGINFHYVKSGEKTIVKNDILIQSEKIEEDVNKDLIRAQQDSLNQKDLFYVTEYRLDNERKYTGYVDSTYCPQSFGTLTWIYTNCVYTGEFLDGMYSGSGTFEWKNEGNMLIGSWENNEPTYGMLRYANTMRYIGNFKNFTFEGKGLFDWTTYNNDGSLKSAGWLYEGQFKAGTMAGCYGRITMNRTGTGSGIYYFEGLMSGFPTISANQLGKGKIVFDDKSVYVGQVLYDGTNYYRHGKGEQFFFDVSHFTGASAGGDMRDRIYSYVGEFDRSGWMKGNGVFYFCDNSKNPTSYITGYWDGMTRTGNWVSTKTPKIKNEWKSTSEIEWVHEYYAKLRGYVDIYKDVSMDGKLLMLGPSTLEYWYSSKEDLQPEYDSYNFGIGGSGPLFWRENIDLLDDLTGCPDKILFSEGTNDLAANRTTVAQLLDNMVEIVEKLHAKFPSATIYIQSTNPCASRWNIVNQNLEEDAGLLNIANNYSYVKFIDVFPHYFSNEPVSSYYLEGYGYLKTDMYREDELHFNEKGYELFAMIIKEGLSS